MLDALAAALMRTFPGLTRVAPLRLLGYGFGSLAVETPGGIVFRVARTVQAGAQYAREMQILPLAAGLPVAVPRPEWYVPASDDFLYGLIGYHKLPGDSFEPQNLSPREQEALAIQIGELVRALQRIPPEQVPFPIDRPALHAGWVRLRAVVLPVLKTALRAPEYQKVAAWWEAFLSDKAMLAFHPVFQHGDLWYGNLLAEGNRVVGLIDFQEAGLGDPAQDFVPQLYLGERFMRQVAAAFQKAGGAFDPGFERRLAALWGLREFGGLAYAIEQEDRIELVDALEKIRKGPILSRAGLDGWGGV